MSRVDFTEKFNVNEHLTLSHDELKTLFDLAACAGDASKWFSRSPQSRRDAIRICNTQCTVRTLCYRYAMSQPYAIITQGVWAGMKPEDIQQVYRENNESEKCHS